MIRRSNQYYFQGEGIVTESAFMLKVGEGTSWSLLTERLDLPNRVARISCVKGFEMGF